MAIKLAKASAIFFSPAMIRLLPFLAALAGLTSVAFAEPDSESREQVKELVASLHYQQGTVVIKDGLAKLNIPDNFSFLDAEGASTVLSKIWRNPPDPEVLGLIVPKGFSPVSGNSWAVAISYDSSGFVKDTDADTIDYPKLLKDMQTGIRDANTEREKKGYPAIDLIGWAAPPHYDKATHKFYWAKEIEFGGEPDHTLNYCIRVLGRKGVLELNAIASMAQLPEIEKEMPSVISMVDFEQGHRYVDFDPKVDKIAGYGLAALVVGGVAAKAGLFKGILIAILAAKKFVVMGAIALWAGIRRLFKRT